MISRAPAALGWVVLIVLLAGAWVTLIAPARSDAAALAAEIAAAEQRLDVATAQTVTAEAARASSRQNRKKYARLGKAVPATAGVASLVLQLEAAAKRAKVDFSAVRVENVAPTAPAPPVAAVTPPADGAAAPTADAGATPAPDAAVSTAPAITPVPFTFTFNGDYFDLRRLLTAVHRFAGGSGKKSAPAGRLLTIDDVALSAGSRGLPHVQAEVTARAYVAPPLAVPPAAGASR